MRDEDAPFIRSIDAPARIVEGGYAQRDVASLLDEIETERPRRVSALGHLAPEDLRRRGEHDQAGRITVSDIVHQWAYHDLMHLAQIAAIVQSTLLGRMGNTRKFYDV
jgi:hypothetical protein